MKLLRTLILNGFVFFCFEPGRDSHGLTLNRLRQSLKETVEVEPRRNRAERIITLDRGITGTRDDVQSARLVIEFEL